MIQKLHSDQGREFESDLSGEVCNLWVVHMIQHQPYTLWSDWIVEYLNCTVHQVLRAYVQEQRDRWEYHLESVIMADNDNELVSTGYSLFKLMHSTYEALQLLLDMLNDTSVSFCHSSIVCLQTFMEEHWIVSAIVS